MGNKINPRGFRLGVIKGWDHRWYEKKKFADVLHEDIRIRTYIEKRLERGEVAKIEIIRYPERIIVNIHTSRPGIVIGKGGKDIERLKSDSAKLTDKRIHINIVEVKDPELSAKLVADGIARQLRSRVAHTKAMKQAVANVMRKGAKGVKILCSGRLGGAEMSRSKEYKEGRVPLHTLRADIDYALSTSLTTFGIIGVKVWIFKGEVIGKEQTSKMMRSEDEPGLKRNKMKRNKKSDEDYR